LGRVVFTLCDNLDIKDMKFKFTVNGKVFHANMTDNDIVIQIAQNLPMEREYLRFSGHEYYTRLPFPTSDRRCKKEFQAHKNEIWYFGGWNAFTILFGDYNTAPFEVVKLGEMVEDIASYISGLGDKITILCEIDG